MLDNWINSIDTETWNNWVLAIEYTLTLFVLFATLVILYAGIMTAHTEYLIHG